MMRPLLRDSFFFSPAPFSQILTLLLAASDRKSADILGSFLPLGGLYRVLTLSLFFTSRFGTR